MTLKKSLKDIGIVGISKIVLSASGIILLPLISKILGSEGYGLWSQSKVTIGLVANLTALGLGASLVRYLPSEQNDEVVGEIYYSSILGVLGVNLITAIVLLIFLRPISSLIFDGYTIVLLLVIIIIPVNSVLSLSKNFFRGKSEMKKYSIFMVAEKLIVLTLVILFLNIGMEIYGAIFSILIGKLSLFLITNYLIIKRIGIKFPKFGKIKELIGYGSPLIFTVIFGWIVTSSDRYMISYFLDISQVGIYSAAYGLGIIIYSLSTPIQKVLKPNLSGLYDEGKKDDVKNQLKQILRLYLLFAIPAFFGLLALSRELLTFLSTHSIATEGYLITPIVALAGILWGCFGVFYIPLILEKKTKILSLMWGISAVSNFVLNLFVIPIYGIIGAAVTTLIAYTISLLVVISYSSKLLNIDFDWSYLFKFLISAIIMFLVIYLYAPSGLIGLVSRILIGIIVYFSVLYLLDGFRKGEKSFIKEKLKKLK